MVCTYTYVYAPLVAAWIARSSSGPVGSPPCVGLFPMCVYGCVSASYTKPFCAPRTRTHTHTPTNIHAPRPPRRRHGRRRRTLLHFLEALLAPARGQLRQHRGHPDEGHAPARWPGRLVGGGGGSWMDGWSVSQPVNVHAVTAHPTQHTVWLVSQSASECACCSHRPPTQHTNHTHIHTQQTPYPPPSPRPARASGAAGGGQGPGSAAVVAAAVERE